MSLSDRKQRFQLPQATQGAERPKIWIDGRQRPRFNAGAYWAVTVGMARRDLLPEMAEAEARLSGFGQRIQSGEVTVRLDWAGRAGRALPSRPRVAGWVLGLARLFAGTRRLIIGEQEIQRELAYPDLIRSTRPVASVRPRSVARSAARPAVVEPTLHAIRSALGETPHDAALDRRAASPASTPAPEAKVTGAQGRRVTRILWRLGCRMTLGLLMAFALPGGAVRAMLFHLNGGDLADWS